MYMRKVLLPGIVQVVFSVEGYDIWLVDMF
jgi:hypothetical protein